MTGKVSYYYVVDYEPTMAAVEGIRLKLFASQNYCEN